jgi:hypothetical protein
MGYYVEIVKSTAYIPKAHLQTAYEKMCALNVTHDDQKNGGSYSGGKQVEKWFSWMDANYPETCKDAKEVLEQLGFECEYNANGDLLIQHYDSKTGQEDLFMDAIENEVVGEILWQGEENERWTVKFYGDMVMEAEPTTKLLD